MYQVKVNDKYDFNIVTDQEGIKINEELLSIDSVRLNATTQHIIYQHQSYTVEVVELPAASVAVQITVVLPIVNVFEGWSLETFNCETEQLSEKVGATRITFAALHESISAIKSTFN